MIHQFLILILIVSAGFSSLGFIFWFLFKKDAPSLEELKQKV
jgi:hypothetical protein